MVDDVVLNPGTGGDTIAAEDIAGIKYQLIKIILGADGSNDGPISATNPLPVSVPSGLATSAKQDSIITALTTLLGYNDGIETLLAGISGKDFATQATLAAVLAKMIAAPSTEAKQDTGNTSLSTIAGKDFATQTTLAALLAKIIAAPATEAKQDTVITKLNSSVAVTGPLTDTQLRTTAVPVSGTFWQTTQPVSGPLTDTQLRASNLPIAIAARIFTFSAAGVNTSSVQLTAGATFTGGVEDVLSQPAYSVLFFSDQNATIVIKQFLDSGGTKLVQTLTYSYTANGTFARSGTMNGDYFQILITNTGGSTTTTLRLETAYGDILPATQLNNGPVALNEVNGSAISLGQATAVNSLPVVIASNQTAIPTSLPAVTATGTITTQNLVPAGTATASSAVEITLAGAMGLGIQSTGTYTGALSLQVTADGTNWITLGGTPIVNLNTGGGLASITSALQSVFQSEVGGFLKARITALAAVTGTATITLIAIPNAPMVSLDAALPTGANVIGAVTQSGTWTAQIGNTPNTVAILSNPLTPATGTTGDTGAKTATGNGATQTNATSKGALIVLNLGTVSGTGPTLVLKLQGSADGGTTWVDIPGATTATLIATGVFGIQIYPGLTALAGTTTTGTTAVVSGALPRSWRVVWTIGGTTPSFAITNVQVSYLI